MNEDKILVVEDDESLGLVLSDALKQEGYRVEWKKDGEVALKRCLEGRYDLVLLDLMLPKVDGYEICRRMRAAGNETPVLMLTARGREEDRVKGLDLGADDYVAKPFSMVELLARIRARIRATKRKAPDRVRVGDAEVDFLAMRVKRGDAVEEITRTEAGVLRLFAEHPGEVLSRNRFLDEVWGLNAFPTTRTVDMHVARVREKIGDDGQAPRFIKTIHGVGYRYDPPEPLRAVDEPVSGG